MRSILGSELIPCRHLWSNEECELLIMIAGILRTALPAQTKVHTNGQINGMSMKKTSMFRLWKAALNLCPYTQNKLRTFRTIPRSNARLPTRVRTHSKLMSSLVHGSQGMGVLRKQVVSCSRFMSKLRGTYLAFGLYKLGNSGVGGIDPLTFVTWGVRLR